MLNYRLVADGVAYRTVEWHTNKTYDGVRFYSRYEDGILLMITDSYEEACESYKRNLEKDRRVATACGMEFEWI